MQTEMVHLCHRTVEIEDLGQWTLNIGCAQRKQRNCPDRWGCDNAARPVFSLVVVDEL